MQDEWTNDNFPTHDNKVSNTIIEMLLALLLIFNLSKCLSLKSRSSINIGIFGDKYTSGRKVDVEGTHNIAAMLLAINEINNKTDGLYDDLLPSTTIKFALRSTQGNFLSASNAAQDFALHVFNGSGVVGAVGSGHDESSRAMGQTFGFTPFKVVNVDYGANASELSHGGTYPYFTRTCASNGFEGRILARLIKQQYGWTNVNLFSTADTYGTDTSLEFLDEAMKLGLNVEHKFNFWPGTKDFKDSIDSTKTTGVLTVFVLLMKSVDAGTFLEAGYNAGLFTQGTQILGTQFVVNPATWKSMSTGAPVAKIMKGVIGITPILDRDTSTFTTFMKRYLAQPSSKTVDIDGTVSCNHRKDDDGHTFLYQDKVTTKASECAGLDFSSLAVDGSDVPDSAVFAYDAVLGLANGLHIVLYENGNVNFTGDDLTAVMLGGMTYTGASGRINFFAGYGGAEGYALGDRQIGLKYRILNFNPQLYHAYSKIATGAVRTLGTWNADHDTYQLCDMDYDDSCSEPVYNSNGGELVDDTPTVIEVQLSDVVRNALRAGGALCLFVVLWFLFIVLLFMDTRLIKSAQPSILLIILFGAATASVRVFVATLDITDSVCIAGKWLGHLSFALVFGAMIVRTWRVSKVVNGGFSKVRITKERMHMLLAAAVGLFCVYLAIDTAVGRPHRAYEETYDGHNNVRQIKCKNADETTTMVLFAVEGIFLIYGAKLTWNNKNVPSAVDDSKYITLALYLVIFVCAVTFPIVFLSIDPTPENLIIIMATGFIFATVGCLVLMFAPKTSLLFEGADVDENLHIVRGEDANSLDSSRHSVTASIRKRILAASGSMSGPTASPKRRDSASGKRHATPSTHSYMKRPSIKESDAGNNNGNGDRVHDFSVIKESSADEVAASMMVGVLGVVKEVREPPAMKEQGNQAKSPPFPSLSNKSTPFHSHSGSS
eukprot:gene5118-10239_t